MNNYKNLKVWQDAVSLAVNIYKTTNQFPKEELYGLTSQIRRSAVSIASNIAEGSGRNSKKEFNQFLGIAHGSSFELDTQLIIASEVGFLNQEEYLKLSQDLIEIQKMNSGLKKSLT
ncbi:four helix bundle protein [Fulvivirga sp.]|jgi:four helix bundle protein|uniref:four helix bundle protein n=1 Tax=Fulvivirga sp. TaxID=1931237 RepID=UPI0032F00BAE